MEYKCPNTIWGVMCRLVIQQWMVDGVCKPFYAANLTRCVFLSTQPTPATLSNSILCLRHQHRHHQYHHCHQFNPTPIVIVYPLVFYAAWVWWVVRISGGWMDFLEDLWILVLLPPLPPLSTAIHCNPAIFGTEKTFKLGRWWKVQGMDSDKLSSWGLMGAVGVVHEQMIVWRNQGN